MKKVLFVANVYKHLYTFHKPYIQMLKDNGCQVDVIATRDDREITNADNCYYWDLTRSPYSFRTIKAYYQLKTIIKREKYDLIHCHTATASTVARLAASSLRKKIGTKVLYTAHGFHFYKGSPRIFWLIYYPIEKILSKHSDGIVLINSEDYHLVLNNGFKNKNTYRINGIGIDSKRFVNVDLKNGKKQRKIEGYHEDQFLMIYVAEFIHRKNHKFLVDASLELSKKMDNFKILFVGRGKIEQEIRQYTLMVGAYKYIDFLGVRLDLDALFPMCDIGISSSRQEGLGLAMVESMLCGLPVLATQIRGHRESIIHGETGYLFDQGNMAQFIKYAVMLSENRNERIKMGRAAHLHAQKFKIEQTLATFADIYSEIMGEPIKYVQ